jgi:hypothetical protein
MFENSRERLKVAWKGTYPTDEEIDKVVLGSALSLVASRSYHRGEDAVKEHGFLPPIVAEQAINDQYHASDIALGRLFNRIEQYKGRYTYATYPHQLRIQELAGEMEEEYWAKAELEEEM